MPRLKPGQEVLEKMIEKERRQSEFISYGNQLASLFNADFWNMIKVRLKNEDETIQARMDRDLMEMTGEQIHIERTKQNILRRISTMPEDIIHSLKAMTDQNTKLKQEIKLYAQDIERVRS